MTPRFRGTDHQHQKKVRAGKVKDDQTSLYSQRSGIHSQSPLPSGFDCRVFGYCTPLSVRTTAGMSSFFTLPASQRKRKREDRATAPASKKRGVSGNGDDKEKKGKGRKERDESISESELDDDEELSGSAESEEESESESDEGETAAEKRLRLAESYLENIREEVDDVGFDAAEIDRDLIAERLKEDVVGLHSCSLRRGCSSPCSRTNSKDVCSGKLQHNCLSQRRRTPSSVQTLSLLPLSLSTHLTFIQYRKTRR